MERLTQHSTSSPLQLAKPLPRHQSHSLWSTTRGEGTWSHRMLSALLWSLWVCGWGGGCSTECSLVVCLCAEVPSAESEVSLWSSWISEIRWGAEGQRQTEDRRRRHVYSGGHSEQTTCLPTVYKRLAAALSAHYSCTPCPVSNFNVCFTESLSKKYKNQRMIQDLKKKGWGEEEGSYWKMAGS